MSLEAKSRLGLDDWPVSLDDRVIDASALSNGTKAKEPEWNFN